jgi:hypothetical protein
MVFVDFSRPASVNAVLVERILDMELSWVESHNWSFKMLINEDEI